jgi:hypothetical protein
MIMNGHRDAGVLALKQTFLHLRSFCRLLLLLQRFGAASLCFVI